jgi:membrane protease YdiL (CAAX protease family)
VALVIGAILAAPVFTWRVPRLFIDSVTFASLPANDEALNAWFRGHENVLDLEIQRIEQSLRIKYVRHGLSAGRLDPDWSDLGYGRVRSGENSVGISFGRMFRDSWILLSMLGSSQIGFLLMGIRVRRQLSAVPSFLPRTSSAKSDIMWGAATGSLMIGASFLYDLLLHLSQVEPRLAAGPWAAISEMPLVAFVGLFLSGSILVPICEELFFRGALLEGFRVDGAARAGIPTSSVLFAVVHLDLINTTVLVLFGVILAVLYLRTRSLLSCIIAHGINNAVAITFLRVCS